MEYIEVKDLDAYCGYCKLEEYIESPLTALLKMVKLHNCEYTIMDNDMPVATIKPVEIV
jgi:hypothetical protein